ncbi:MAG: YbhB/YbcL family Raf kinase inhibitor-like protein [Elusimicrobia bacterium]|nr:YbhB/YbcL family Raf kinase inhibitor-like protein [Elusimicrobiota bacterium]
MNHSLIAIMLCAGLLCPKYSLAAGNAAPNGPVTGKAAAKPTPQFAINIPAFKDGEAVPVQFTCDGANRPPEILISGTPKGARTLALLLHDTDAPAGDWTHWLVYNLPPSTTKLALPLPGNAEQGVNDYGKTEYYGPCPPPRTHNYYFEVYALSSALKFKHPPHRADLLYAIEGKTLAKAQ